jgi:hypothetical protein
LSEEKSSAVSIIEAHEEFIQHIEKGSSKIRALSAITVLISTVLLGSYAYQLLLPYVSDVRFVTVDLVDPLLQATELILCLFALVWLYVGIRDYLFTRRMAKAIGEARAFEKRIEERISG